MVGCGPVDSAAHVLPIELSAGRRGTKHLADRGTTDDELGSCSLDVRDDQVGRHDVPPELLPNLAVIETLARVVSEQ